MSNNPISKVRHNAGAIVVVGRRTARLTAKGWEIENTDKRGRKSIPSRYGLGFAVKPERVRTVLEGLEGAARQLDKLEVSA